MNDSEREIALDLVESYRRKWKQAERERDLHHNTIGEMQAKLDKANGRCTLDQMNDRIMDLREQRRALEAGDE